MLSVQLSGYIPRSNKTLKNLKRERERESPAFSVLLICILYV